MLSGPERWLEQVEWVLEEFEKDKARIPGASKWCPHIPDIPMQKAFLECEEVEALYGGAAGGGKTDALLMGALQYVDVPGYAALILRRTFRDLNQPNAIMHRAHKWLRGTDAQWQAESKRYVFPSGASLTFGYLEHERDLDQYDGPEFQHIAWDELVQFPLKFYLFLFGRLRKPTDGELAKVPLKVRGATNPGNIGHEWVRRRFVEPLTRQAPFFPSRYQDNHHLDQDSYQISLDKLDAVTKAQRRDGIWTRDAEGLVYSWNDTRNGIDVAPTCSKKVLALDFGTTSPTSFTTLGWRPGDPTVYILSSWKRAKLTPSETGQLIKDLETEGQFDSIIGDIGGLGKGYAVEARRHFGVPIQAAEKNNKLGYIKLFNGELEHGRVKVVRSACAELIKEWEELPKAPDDSEISGFDNHCADGALYGWRQAKAYLVSRKSGMQAPAAIPGPFQKH